MGELLGTIFGPIGTLFHAVFYEPVYNILILLYHVTNSFALSIVLLTVLLRLCLLPLTRKQLQSSRKMQELQPQIKALQAQYRGDPQGLMAAQRALFKENNYSQAQGCLPLLIQMPVLYSLFFAFQTVIGKPVNGHPPTVAQHLLQMNQDIYPFLPHVTHILPTLFMWVNLAHPDPIHLLPLVAAVLTFIQLRMAMPVRPKPQPGQASDATAQATKMTMYLMPAMTFIFGLNFPAGMALYWSIGTMFMIVQQYFLAGFGSLFVGIPGMERFVPEPKQSLTPPAPVGRNGARPGTYSASSAARSALAETPSARTRPTATPAAPSPSPVSGGVFARLREQWAAVQRQAQEAAAARAETLAAANAKIVDSTAEVDGDDAEQPAASAQADASASARAQRQRPAKQAPQLVKPSHTPAATELPAATIPRVGTNGNGNGATKPPQPASNGSGANGNSTNGGKAGVSGAVSVRRESTGAPSGTRPLNSGQRKGSGGAKGAAATRTRPAGSANGAGSSGRPKGGR